jgi:CBS domain-containing protein
MEARGTRVAAILRMQSTQCETRGATAFERPVREYASKTLVSARLDASLVEVKALLDEHAISAVPIVDARGALRGIVSTKDLLRATRIELSLPRDVARFASLPRTASGWMRTNVIVVDENAPVRVAAAKMVEHRIHRVVVMRGAIATAIISTRDVMRAVLQRMLETPLDRVMTKAVVTIELGESIRSAIHQLDESNVRGLVVVDGRWPMGVFTHFEALHARALPPTLLDSPVESMMSCETICLDAKTPLYRVATHALEMGVRRVLAVRNRSLCGIASGFDLARAACE